MWMLLDTGTELVVAINTYVFCNFKLVKLAGSAHALI